MTGYVTRFMTGFVIRSVTEFTTLFMTGGEPSQGPGPVWQLLGILRHRGPGESVVSLKECDGQPLRAGPHGLQQGLWQYGENK